MGSINDKTVRQLMYSADVFLHHSVTASNGDEEGIPTVIMEAMATGLPVISTFHSGIPELITNNYDGFLVEEGNVNTYTETLISLANLSNEIGVRARKKIVEDFNFNKEMQKQNFLYSKLINKELIN